MRLIRKLSHATNGIQSKFCLYKVMELCRENKSLQSYILKTVAKRWEKPI